MNNHAQIRANLNKLNQKLNSGRCRIAYMGSSVTVQKEGYRIFLQQFLREYFDREHLEICAAIGGVGAITGVFTMDEDVINYAPDLCFVEYMVSDRIEANTPQSEIGKVIEGVVRKLNKIDCNIVFLYRYLKRNSIDDRYQYALNEYEKIARHYNITSINFGSYIQKCIDRQQYAHQDLFKDHTHTTVKGSKIAAQYIANVLKNIFKSNYKVEQKPNLEPIYNNNYENTAISYVGEHFLANNNYVKGSCADKVKNHQSKSKDYQYIEIAADNSFKFKIKGELIGLMVIIGRDSGIVEFSAGEKIEKIMLWDKWCHYDRFSTIILSEKFAEMTEIEIKITDELIDYSSCRRQIEHPEQIVKKLKLVGIMTRTNTEIITINSPQTTAIKSNCLQERSLTSSELTELAKHIIKKDTELDRLLAIQKPPAFYVNLAHAFYELKEYEKSIICFRQAIAINSRLAEDMLPIMQSAKLQQNKPNEARELYQEWIENYYIVSHQHKIIYCPIPKNACTLFKEIIVTNSEHKLDFKKSGLDVHRYIRQNNVKLAERTYLSNPEYLKIAIVRNPFERLVSAYFNKFVRPKKASNIVKNVITDIYCFKKLKPDYQRSITFSDFINYLARTEDYFLNEHWRSQYFFLGMGLFEFDLFHSLEKIDDVIQQLESRIGVKIGHKKTNNKTNYSESLSQKDWHLMYPPQLRKLKQLPTASSLYTSELTDMVKSRFACDIKILNNL